MSETPLSNNFDILSMINKINWISQYKRKEKDYSGIVDFLAYILRNRLKIELNESRFINVLDLIVKTNNKNSFQKSNFIFSWREKSRIIYKLINVKIGMSNKDKESFIKIKEKFWKRKIELNDHCFQIINERNAFLCDHKVWKYNNF